jgi:iron(III) transport system ATP-binding protein
VSWVAINGLTVAYGTHPALTGIDLNVDKGSVVAVLGPSGCGKTTLLRSIAGLLPVTRGSIRIGERDVSTPTVHVPPEKRGIGWVPQDASLFPHLNVRENIGFGVPRGERRHARIADLAELVGLTDYLDRSPAQLSGGQAHRVSLARALAPHPAVVLLDEPFAALDPMLRVALRAEVAELLRSENSTAILVTHDQEEALSLSDKVAIMRGGRILQYGTPLEVYELPASPWIAGFVGDTVEFPGTWREGLAECPLGVIAALPMGELRRDQAIRVVIRPEWVALDPHGAPARVATVSYAGHDALVTLELPSGDVVRSRIPAPALPALGDEVGIVLRHRALAYPEADHGTP